MKLPKAECIDGQIFGWTQVQVEAMLKEAIIEKFNGWMYGQTMMEHPETKETIYYTHDVMRFINGLKLPVVLD